MKRTSNSRSSLFLIELIIAILFFSLVSAVCLRAFARSHILTENARDLNAALMHVESTAELLRAGESVEAQTFYSSSWDTCEEKKAAYMITVKEEQHGFRYTQYIGKARMEMKAGLTFACMNLKKLAKILELRGKIKSSISYIFKNESKYWLYNEKWCWE